MERQHVNDLYNYSLDLHRVFLMKKLKGNSKLLITKKRSVFVTFANCHVITYVPLETGM